MPLRASPLVLALTLMCGGAAAQTPPSKPSPIPGMPPIQVLDPGPEGQRVAVEGVFANYFPGRGAGTRPAILELGGSEGGLGGGALREAKALQAEGFSVLQLCYFGCTGTPDRLASVPLETFARGLAWLRAQPGVDPDRVGVVGGSKGSEAALLAATRDPKLKAVIATMPSSVAWPGITYAQGMAPSWTEGGQAVPYLPYAPYTAMSKGGIFYLYADALPALPEHPQSIIPVERIGGRIMLVCGEADTLWPSCPMTDFMAARLRAKGRPEPVLLRYKDAGHAVFGVPVERSSPNFANLGALGGTAEGNAAARADAWPKAVAFLKAALQP
jgi:dienelactone hydrolase